MRLTNLKILTEQSAGGGAGTGGAGGGASTAKVKRPNIFPDLNQATGPLDLAQKLVSGALTGVGNVAKYSAVALLNPPEKTMAALSGRQAALGFSKENALQRFKWIRQGLPGQLAKAGIGVVGGLLAGNPTMQKLGSFLTNPATTIGKIGGKIANLAGQPGINRALQQFPSAAGDEIAHILTGMDDFRNTSVLANTRTELKPKAKPQEVKIVP
jgi:hypothetical protein